MEKSIVVLSARAQRAESLASAAAAADLPLATLGGAAVELLCRSAQAGGQWSRDLADVDLATTSKRRRPVEELVVGQGYLADTPFNVMNGSVRLRFFDADGSHLDVFVDEMRLCHPIVWGAALKPGRRTLPIGWLLLSKLQIVRGEAKDFSDLSALLTDQWDEIAAAQPMLANSLRKDWGLLHTASLNLERLCSADDDIVARRAGELLETWRALRPSVRSRLRGVVGERVRWYQEPEEV